MNRNIRSLSGVLRLIILLLLPVSVGAQTYSYRNYDNTNGLPGNFMYALGQDSAGFLWVGLEELYRYDGFEFHHMPLPDTLTAGNPCSMFCDNTGEMWIGFSDGSLFSSISGQPLVQHPIVADRINKILAGPDGNNWIVTQTNGIYISESQKNGELRQLATPEGIIIYDMAFAGNDSLLIATPDNLHLCTIKDDQIVITYSFKELEYIVTKAVVSLPGRRWAVGTDEGLYIAESRGTAFNAHRVTGHPSLESARIPALMYDSDNILYVATQDAGLLKVRFNDDYSEVTSVLAYDVNSGLPDNNVKVILKDRESDLWIGMFTRGLSAVTTNAFSFFRPGDDCEINFIGENSDRVVMGTSKGYYLYDPVSSIFDGFRDLEAETGGNRIITWFIDDEETVWIGTVSAGLYRMGKDGKVKRFYQAANPGQNHINSIAADARNLWLATLYGVVVLDRKTGTRIAEFTTWDRLPHNKILQVVSVKDDEVLVATETDQLCYLNLNAGVRYEGLEMEGITRNLLQSISLSLSGKSITVGTLGNGIFRFRQDTLMNINEADGLLSNHCYSVLDAGDGRIWVGHEKGFSIVNTSVGFIRRYGRDFGVVGDCLPNAIAEASDGKIYVGTSEGVVVYDPAMDQTKPSPPQAAIVSVIIDGVQYPYRVSYNLPYRSSYEIEVRYVGVTLNDPLNVLYRTRWSDDKEWSSLTEERTTKINLGDGHYHFMVEASARDNSTLLTTASFSLVVQKPFFRRWWFIVGVILLIIILAYGIILLRERAHRIQREHLEDELQKRTAEVHQQKEELFQKNLDITESIKYAKRIQSSILPDIVRLNNVFNDAFVFFLPRDIVSGDFYWFDWIDKDNFIVVCADSTGHGVPGAFMSMIGSALLQDIITRKKIVQPSQILLELDRRIFSTLNQNQEIEAANDGMDIIVCLFNVRSKHLVFASAMRPVILVIDGEQQYIRGNRSAVGGESVSEKYYDDQEYYLREGDIVYLFSDGYPDQFGGRMSKKMKIGRLRSLIDEMKHLEMKEQQARIKDFFYEWKGDNEQVDDVIFMGIKV